MSKTVAPNLRVLHILQILAEQGTALSPTEITSLLGWPKQTVHRLCQTMVTAGVLERHNRKLRPANNINRMTAGLAQFAIDESACHQILLRVATQIGETVNFARPQKRGMTYVDRVETNWPFRVLLPVGTHVPFHCTASGKTFLASLPKAQRQAFVANLSLDAATPHTHITADKLSAELSMIRKQGFALDQEEFHLDMVAIAVPVLDHQRRFFAALAIHGPVQRFSIETAKSCFPLLTESAAQISKTLFGDTAT